VPHVWIFRHGIHLRCEVYHYDGLHDAATHEVSRSRSVYRGEQFDPDLGLYYLRARYFNPATGSFLTQDPEGGETADPKTLHKYLYAGGNPVNVLDPSGRAAIFEYEFSIGDRTFSVAIHGAHHYWTALWLGNCGVSTFSS
jgi:RHS repeat-associated protein